MPFDTMTLLAKLGEDAVKPKRTLPIKMTNQHIEAMEYSRNQIKQQQQANTKSPGADGSPGSGPRSLGPDDPDEDPPSTLDVMIPSSGPVLTELLQHADDACEPSAPAAATASSAAATASPRRLEPLNLSEFDCLKAPPMSARSSARVSTRLSARLSRASRASRGLRASDESLDRMHETARAATDNETDDEADDEADANAPDALKEVNEAIAERAAAPAPVPGLALEPTSPCTPNTILATKQFSAPPPEKLSLAETPAADEASRPTAFASNGGVSLALGMKLAGTLHQKATVACDAVADRAADAARPAEERPRPSDAKLNWPPALASAPSLAPLGSLKLSLGGGGRDRMKSFTGAADDLCGEFSSDDDDSATDEHGGGGGGLKLPGRHPLLGSERGSGSSRVSLTAASPNMNLASARREILIGKMDLRSSARGPGALPSGRAASGRAASGGRCGSNPNAHAHLAAMVSAHHADSARMPRNTSRQTGRTTGLQTGRTSGRLGAANAGVAAAPRVSKWSQYSVVAEKAPLEDDEEEDDERKSGDSRQHKSGDSKKGKEVNEMVSKYGMSQLQHGWPDWAPPERGGAEARLNRLCEVLSVGVVCE